MSYPVGPVSPPIPVDDVLIGLVAAVALVQLLAWALRVPHREPVSLVLWVVLVVSYQFGYVGALAESISWGSGTLALFHILPWVLVANVAAAVVGAVVGVLTVLAPKAVGWGRST